MRMHIEKADPADAQAARACHEVHLAAQRADEPYAPPLTERPFRGWLSVGWVGDPRELWLARSPGGAVAGWYRLELPDMENLDRAWLDLTVRPEERRRGIGRDLLRHAAARAQAHRRPVLGAGTRDGTPGEAFARSQGGTPELVEVQRVMELGPSVSPGRLGRLRETAERAAADYSLLSWTGPVPDELIEQAVELYAALNDAPRSPEAAAEIWDAQRVRERVNDLHPHLGLREYAVAARHEASGELAALTQVGVDPADPGWGIQMNTAVIRKHRGHRLGLRVKIAMLELLATAEPQLERIVTWNAEANKYMIAVNEALGYTILGQPTTRWRFDAAALPSAGNTAQS